MQILFANKKAAQPGGFLLCRHCEEQSDEAIQLLIRYNPFMKAKQPCFYIMANRYRGTTYSGVTSEPSRRFFEHREGMIEGFSKRYGCKLLVYYEIFDDMASAIAREKQIKGGSRQDKIALIESVNPGWNDLYETLA